MLKIFNFFSRTPLTYKEGLPRTIAPIMAAAGAQSGLAAGFVAGMIVATFSLDDPAVKEETAFTIVGASSIVGAAMNGFAGYVMGHRGANLLMRAHPELEKMESRFLLKAGFRPQFYLFCGAFLLPLAIKALEDYIGGKTSHSRPSTPKI